MALKATEPHAAKALEELVAGYGLPVSWKPGGDPPDLIFTGDGSKWAVEETQLHSYSGGPDKPASAQGYEIPIRKACRRIKAVASTLRPMGYIISISWPVASLPELESKALDYVRSGRTDRMYLAEDDSSYIKGVPTQRHRFELLIGPKSATPSPDGKSHIADIGASVRYGLARVLGEKVPVLQQFPGYGRRVLLVTNRDFFVEPEDVVAALATIFAANPGWTQGLDAVVFVTVAARLVDGHPANKYTAHVVSTPSGWRFPYRV